MKKNNQLFWTDKIANEILNRKKFYYTEDKITKFKKFVVKTSASLSGVLHIGRLSDTIRGDAVYKSLIDAGVDAELIWVAEDMDPLRKVPEGVPKNYIDFIGMPVTDIPDPENCHKSYADHHVSKYFEVLDKFVSTKMEKFSMREEYKKGKFKKWIKILLEKIEELKEIQNKYRKKNLTSEWNPWTPLCDNCGKIITPVVKGIENGKVHYTCNDYSFEKNIAKGCGYEGENNPLKGNGKLLWKSEWAAQWVRWNVCSEGAGKEYQVPGSAFWINGEVVERILKFPMPVPIFYEHLTINGKKMSASVGNIIYPREVLEVAPPELLRLLYLKDPMRERDFRWDFVPNMMDEIDNLEKLYFDITETGNERDVKTLKRLFEAIQIKQMPSKYSQKISYNTFLEIAKILPEKNQLAFTIQKLKDYDLIGKNDRNIDKYVKNRLIFARNLLKIITKEEKIEFKLNESEKKLVHNIINLLQKESNQDVIQSKLFEIIKSSNIEIGDGFKLIYNIILNSDKGPRLGPYIIERGKEEVIKKLKDVL